MLSAFPVTDFAYQVILIHVYFKINGLERKNTKNIKKFKDTAWRWSVHKFPYFFPKQCFHFMIIIFPYLFTLRKCDPWTSWSAGQKFPMYDYS